MKKLLHAVLLIVGVGFIIYGIFGLEEKHRERFASQDHNKKVISLQAEIIALQDRNYESLEKSQSEWIKLLADCRHEHSQCRANSPNIESDSFHILTPIAEAWLTVTNLDLSWHWTNTVFESTRQPTVSVSNGVWTITFD